jgi:hypothetical protein
MKSMRKIWTGHVACMVKNVYKIVVGKAQKHLEDMDAGRGITLKYILKEHIAGCGLDKFGSGQGTVAVSCEHGNEPFISIICREFVDPLSGY